MSKTKNKNKTMAETFKNNYTIIMSIQKKKTQQNKTTKKASNCL
jgi:hypothetical protein